MAWPPANPMRDNRRGGQGWGRANVNICDSRRKVERKPMDNEWVEWKTMGDHKAPIRKVDN